MNFNKKKSEKEIKTETEKNYDNLYLSDNKKNDLDQKDNFNDIEINLREQ